MGTFFLSDPSTLNSRTAITAITFAANSLENPNDQTGPPAN
jgi:hypothetical protein